MPRGRFSSFPGFGIHTLRVGATFEPSFSLFVRARRCFGVSDLVESREAIMLRPSLLDLDVPVSVYPAPEYL